MTDLAQAVAGFEAAVEDCDRLEAEKNRLREEILAKVAQELAALDLEFAAPLDAAERRKQEAEMELRAAVLIAGQAIKGRFVRAAYVKGRVSWDTRGLDRYAQTHPDVLQFRREGDPSTQITIGAPEE